MQFELVYAFLQLVSPLFSSHATNLIIKYLQLVESQEQP